jgi:hypothetical protein
MKVDEAQASYWQAPVTRSEIQNVLDEYAQATIQLKTQVMNLDFAVAYLVEKFGITPDEIREFMTKKIAEFTTSQESQNKILPN